MIPVLLTFFGCFSNYWWKELDEMNSLDPSEVPYRVDGLEATDAMITSFDSGLLCPDGETATFMAVYREGQTENVPVAIVFHSGAFDYVLDPDEDQPLAGEHYYLDSRLLRSWSVSKIWETLGMLSPRTLDDAEQNLGALPAALTDAGVVQIYPGNCWGDLWHNDPGSQDNSPVDGFERSGRTMALDMVEMLLSANKAADLGFSIPVTIDTSQLYLVGLGEGGRAVTELLLSDELPPVAGVLLDSTPDDLSAYTADEDAFAAEVEGLSRIYGEDGLADLASWSFLSVPEDDQPDRVAFLWSSQDPRVPLGAVEATAEALEAGGAAWVYDTGARAHVASNADVSFARDVVDYLLNGQVPSSGE